MTNSLDSEFAPTPEAGDMLRLSNLVQEAGQADEQIKTLEKQLKQKKELRRQLLEVTIPDVMQTECGGLSSVEFFGTKIELKDQTFAGIPSPSSIAKEKDDDVRDEMITRRDAALALLEELAPTLIKRSYEIEFDRDDQDAADEFEAHLDEMEDAPNFVKGLSVHPATLAKWFKERKESGDALTEEQCKILGVMTRMVAKITR